jgi:hypothetical protein
VYCVLVGTIVLPLVTGMLLNGVPLHADTLTGDTIFGFGFTVIKI